MKVRMSFVWVLFLMAIVNPLIAQQLPGENIYWPGNFEQSLYGGNFSRARGVEIVETQNHTHGGERSWHLVPGQYQHIELLTTGTGKFKLQFFALSDIELTVVIKEVVKTGEGQHVTEDYPVSLKHDGKWHNYEIEFEVQSPYPGPETGEVLITCYNDTNSDAWIDDLELNRISPKHGKGESPATLLVKDAINNGNFDFGNFGWVNTSNGNPINENAIIDLENRKTLVSLSTNGIENTVPGIAQKIDARDFAGKTIQISCDVGFLSITDDAKSWSGLVVTLKKGADTIAELLPGNPSPHWCVLGLAPPPKQLKKISATYNIPNDAETLFLEISAQKGMGGNIGVVDNVILEIIR